MESAFEVLEEVVGGYVQARHERVCEGSKSALFPVRRIGVALELPLYLLLRVVVVRDDPLLPAVRAEARPNQGHERPRFKTPG